MPFARGLLAARDDDPVRGHAHHSGRQCEATPPNRAAYPSDLARARSTVVTDLWRRIDVDSAAKLSFLVPALAVLAA